MPDRTRGPHTKVLHIHDVASEMDAARVRRRGRPGHANRILTRDMIEAHVWNYDFVPGSNVIDVYVRRLRRKVDEPFAIRLLETVRGVGYRLVRPDGRQE